MRKVREICREGTRVMLQDPTRCQAQPPPSRAGIGPHRSYGPVPRPPDRGRPTLTSHNINKLPARIASRMAKGPVLRRNLDVDTLLAVNARVHLIRCPVHPRSGVRVGAALQLSETLSFQCDSVVSSVHLQQRGLRADNRVRMGGRRFDTLPGS